MRRPSAAFKFDFLPRIPDLEAFPLVVRVAVTPPGCRASPQPTLLTTAIPAVPRFFAPS